MHEEEAEAAAPAREERAALRLEAEQAVGGAVADPGLVVDERVLLLGLGLGLGLGLRLGLRLGSVVRVRVRVRLRVRVSGQGRD
jgi:hypothetical protein